MQHHAQLECSNNEISIDKVIASEFLSPSDDFYQIFYPIQPPEETTTDQPFLPPYYYPSLDGQLGVSTHPICANCGTDFTPAWRRIMDRMLKVCNACALYYKQVRHIMLNFIQNFKDSILNSTRVFARLLLGMAVCQVLFSNWRYISQHNAITAAQKERRCGGMILKVTDFVMRMFYLTICL